MFGGQSNDPTSLVAPGSHPDVRKVEELAARCAQAGRPRHPLGSPLTAAHFASVPDLSAYTQACHEFLPHSAALPVQPPWNGQPLPIEQVRLLSSPKCDNILSAVMLLRGW